VRALGGDLDGPGMVGAVAELGDIDHVRSAVSHLTPAVGEDEPPPEVASPGRVRHLRRVDEPEVVVEAFGRIADRLLDLVPLAHLVVMPVGAGQVDPDCVEPTDPAATNEFAGEPGVTTGAFLTAGLEHAVVALDGVADGSALSDRVGQRLLAVDVLATVERSDAGQRVPVVRRADADRVDVLAGNECAEVLIGSAVFVAVLLVDNAANSVAMFGLDVADSHKLDSLALHEVPHVAGPLAAHTDGAHDDAVARSHRSVLTEHGCGNDVREAHRTDGGSGLGKHSPTGGLLLGFHGFFSAMVARHWKRVDIRSAPWDAFILLCR